MKFTVKRNADGYEWTSDDGTFEGKCRQLDATIPLMMAGPVKPSSDDIVAVRSLGVDEEYNGVIGEEKSVVKDEKAVTNPVATNSVSKNPVAK